MYNENYKDQCSELFNDIMILFGNKFKNKSSEEILSYCMDILPFLNYAVPSLLFNNNKIAVKKFIEGVNELANKLVDGLIEEGKNTMN